LLIIIFVETTIHFSFIDATQRASKEQLWLHWLDLDKN